MNIKVKENAGSFEQSFAKMLDKIYGNNGNVKVEVKKTHDGTLYTVLNDFDQVDFLFKTDKGTKAPTCDITIGGDTLFTKTGDPKKKVKTYYGLFDEDPTILRSFQQILQKYIDGVDLDLPWLRFEESKKNEANIEDLRDKSVSHGTMHPKHLIPVFLDVLKTYAPEKYNAYVKENQEVLDLDGIDDETLGYVVEELFDKLNEIAPDGTYFGSHPGDGSDYGFWSVDPDESKCGKDKDDKGNDGKDGKPNESSKPVKNILRRRFEVLTKSVLKACDNLAKGASLAGDFDDELIYAEDAVKNAVESFNEMGNAIIRLKTVLEHHKNEDNMDVIGILSDAITKIVADEQGDELDSETAGADSVIDQVEKEYSGETENEPEANGGENEAPNPAENEPPTEF